MKMLMAVAVALMLAMPSVGFGGDSYEAAREGNVEAIKEMLKEPGAKVDARDEHGYTLLNYAAMYGNVDVIKVLVEAGADLNAMDKEGWLPLHHAARKGHVEAIKVLLKEGADVNAVDKDGVTPLHHAAGGGHVEAVKVLLKEGANVNAVDRNGWTPLELAKKGRDSKEGFIKPYQEIIRLLREAGAR